MRVFFEIKFDEDLAQLNAEEFVRDFFKKINPGSICAGDDFKFGRGREGDLALFKKIFPELKINSVELLSLKGKKIGSANIRKLIEAGEIHEANAHLGRPFLYESVTVSGRKLGRTIGVPTLNLKLNNEQIVPKIGVYFGYVSFAETPAVFNCNREYACVISVGKNPTVSEGDDIKLEAHLLTPFAAQEFYDQKASLYFCQYLREEKKFPSLEALKRQIDIDIAQARALI